MNALELDPATGFMQSTSPGSFTFDAQKKVQFLELATAYRQANKFPKVSDICDSIGVDIVTFERHLNIDQNFANAWKDIQTHVEYQCISDMSDLRTKNPMYMFGLLRYLNPKRWNPNERPEPTLNINVFSDAVKEVQPVTDAVVVDKCPDIALNSQASPSEEHILARDTSTVNAPPGPEKINPTPPAMIMTKPPDNSQEIKTRSDPENISAEKIKTREQIKADRSYADKVRLYQRKAASELKRRVLLEERPKVEAVKKRRAAKKFVEEAGMQLELGDP